MPGPLQTSDMVRARALQAMGRAGRASGAASLRTSSAATCAMIALSLSPWPMPGPTAMAPSAPIPPAMAVLLHASTDAYGVLPVMAVHALHAVLTHPAMLPCRFFITCVPTPWLDNKHTVWGRVRRLPLALLHLRLPACKS